MNKLPELDILQEGYYRVPVFIDTATNEEVPHGDVLFMYNTLAKMFNGAIEEFNKNDSC